MVLTLTAAAGLNSFFSGYDRALLSLCHRLAEAMGGLLTPLCRLITLLGEKGLLFFLLALVLMWRADTRRAGICLFGAVCCGALITNILLKDAVARPRPFEAAEQFRLWWEFVGSPAEEGFSFPSGHATAAAAGMVALWLMWGRRLALPTVITVVLMDFARNYLMAHYPSDVLMGTLIGAASALIAYGITALIYRFLGTREGPLWDFVRERDLPLPRPGYQGKH